jgi:uncharacterized damage-inducible protein DinB
VLFHNQFLCASACLCASAVKQLQLQLLLLSPLPLPLLLPLLLLFCYGDQHPTKTLTSVSILAHANEARYRPDFPLRRTPVPAIKTTWRSIVASSLDWGEAHATFDHAVADLPDDQRGRRPEGFPHSPWELVEHIRLTQADLLDFLSNADYTAPKWPEDYWPSAPAPSGRAWEESIAAVRQDRESIKQLALREDIDLTERIPWGEGQTFLRTILVAVDHTSYHVGQLIAVRRLLGAWKG